jgi:hypothetical protein
MNLKTISWTDLCRVLLERFPDGQHIDPMEQLQLLKQVTTIDQYINAYETWMTLMKRDRKYLPHDFFVDRFLSGLKDTLSTTFNARNQTPPSRHTRMLANMRNQQF